MAWSVACGELWVDEALVQRRQHPLSLWPKIRRVVLNVEGTAVDIDVLADGEAGVGTVFKYRMVYLVRIDDGDQGTNREGHKNGQAFFDTGRRVDQLHACFVLALHRTQLIGCIGVALTLSVDAAVAVVAEQHQVARVRGKTLGLPSNTASTSRAVGDNVGVFRDVAASLGEEVPVNRLAATAEFAPTTGVDPEVAADSGAQVRPFLCSSHS